MQFKAVVNWVLRDGLLSFNTLLRFNTMHTTEEEIIGDRQHVHIMVTFWEAHSCSRCKQACGRYTPHQVQPSGTVHSCHHADHINSTWPTTADHMACCVYTLWHMALYWLLVCCCWVADVLLLVCHCCCFLLSGSLQVADTCWLHHDSQFYSSADDLLELLWTLTSIILTAVIDEFRDHSRYCLHHFVSYSCFIPHFLGGWMGCLHTMVLCS